MIFNSLPRLQSRDQTGDVINLGAVKVVQTAQRGLCLSCLWRHIHTSGKFSHALHFVWDTDKTQTLRQNYDVTFEGKLQHCYDFNMTSWHSWGRSFVYVRKSRATWRHCLRGESIANCMSVCSVCLAFIQWPVASCEIPLTHAKLWHREFSHAGASLLCKQQCVTWCNWPLGDLTSRLACKAELRQCFTSS